MVTEFQFRSVEKLIDEGVTDYVLIRQRVGLTSQQLDDIIENAEYYQRYFDEQDKLRARRAPEKKKHWWQR